MSQKSQAGLLANIPLASFIQNVASRSPAPGGGSVAALSGSLGAALGSMVCRLTIGKKKYKEFEDEMRRIEKELLPARDIFKDLIDKDTFAFDEVMLAFDLPKETDDEIKIRDEAVNDANKKAASVPFEVMQLSFKTAELIQFVAKNGNVNSVSDVGVAGLSLDTAFKGAKLNVLINIKDMEDSPWKEKMVKDVDALTGKFDPIAQNIQKSVAERLV
jgi:formiminotetrahydrofolate cyclodeaminase